MAPFDWKTQKTEIVPTISFSLAAIVRRRSPDGVGGRVSESEAEADADASAAASEPRYALVHERGDRGWWLPGGGVELIDDTPVDAAIRETMEEAASTSARSRPTMTHLLSLEQTPGRIRFVFRGEWIDDSIDHVGDAPSKTTGGVLKRHPGDEESFEARWVTLDQVEALRGTRGYEGGGTVVAGPNDGTSTETDTKKSADPWLNFIDDSIDDVDDAPVKTTGGVLKRPPGDEESFEARFATLDQVEELRGTRDCERGGTVVAGPNDGTSTETDTKTFADPWLRGHEPLTFFGALHRSREGPAPGIPVRHRRAACNDSFAEMQTAEDPFGAFFVHIENDDVVDVNMSESDGALLRRGGREELNVRFHAHLLVLDESRRTVAVDASTGMFPADRVKDQRSDTLRALVSRMIGDFAGGNNGDGCGGRSAEEEGGLLRVVHVSREGSSDAEISVYVFLRAANAIRSSDPSNDGGAVRWVEPGSVADPLERALAEAMAGPSSSSTPLTASGSFGGGDVGGSGGPPWSLDILRDSEEPFRPADLAR